MLTHWIERARLAQSYICRELTAYPKIGELFKATSIFIDTMGAFSMEEQKETVIHVSPTLPRFVEVPVFGLLHRCDEI